MKNQCTYLLLLLKRLAIVVVIYALFRVLFYSLYQHSFSDLGLWEFAKINLYGLRFDLSAILYTNLLVIALHLFPFQIRQKKWYRRLGLGIFLIFNFLAFYVMVIDLELFKYTQKRSTIDIFAYLTDFKNLFVGLISEFWYLVVLGIILIYGIYFLYQKVEKNVDFEALKPNIFIQILLFIAGIGLTVVGMRGGLQLRPITPISAAHYVSPSLMPLVSNTPFNIIHSYNDKKLTTVQYMSNQEAEALYPIYHRTNSNGKVSCEGRENVVILIMESLSKEYTGLGSDESYTPFLDSLAKHSLVYTNTYANSKQSMQAIPALLASIPALMDEPYLVSSYQDNQLLGMGTAMQNVGYHTAFFHGANNGSFMFDAFTAAAGFQEYYGRTEYANDDDFDGYWGIFDAPFFKFAVQKMTTFPEPFLGAMFSISAHHPYALPDDFKEKFKKGKIPLQELISYSDYALKCFFADAQKQPWFENTLFIITADHTGPPVDGQYGWLKKYEIPLLFYFPDGRYKGEVRETVIQQTDILPTVLEYIDYPNPYTAFGASVFDEEKHPGYSFTQTAGVYQLVKERFLIHFDGNKTIGFYMVDSLDVNRLNEFPVEQKQMEQEIKAIIQQYHHALIKNKLLPTE